MPESLLGFHMGWDESSAEEAVHSAEFPVGGTHNGPMVLRWGGGFAKIGDPKVLTEPLGKWRNRASSFALDYEKVYIPPQKSAAVYALLPLRVQALLA